MQTQTARISVTMGGNCMLCTIHGDIDHHNARTIRAQIDDELYKTRPRKLTLDLSRVEFMDSSGLGLILGRFNKASEIGTEFTLLNPAENVCKILDVAGIGRMIKIERRK